MRRRFASYALIGLAATAAAGGFVLNRILDRPAESSLSMVPADAIGVVSIDLVPAPDQLLAFKSIDDSIVAAGGKIDTPLLGQIVSSITGDDELKPLTDQTDRSIAIVVLPKPGSQNEDDVLPAALVPIHDAGAVASFLRSKGKVETIDGISVVQIGSKKGGPVYLALEDSTVVASPEGWAVAKIVKTAHGQAPSLVQDAGFAAARARALPSANVLVLVSPKMTKGQDWLVGSLTIRDSGLETAIAWQSNDPNVLKAGEIAPLSPNLLASLPKGAYGFLAWSQPGKTFAMAGDALDEPAKEIKESTELDLKNDILPALGGNTVLSFYPSFGPDAGIDLLVSIDDAHDANPAALAKKLESSLNETIERESKGSADDWMIRATVNGADVRRLGGEPEDELQKALGGAEKSFFRPLTLARNKTVVWATVGNTVLLATSQNLMDRAIALRQSPSPALSIATDSAFGSRPLAAAEGQSSLTVSMSRLSQGIRNTVDPSHMSPEAAKVYRKVLGLFDATTEPLALRGATEPDGHVKGYAFIPFDWSKLPGLVKDAK